MTINLGFDALPMEVRLAADSDFTAALIAPDGWPAGAEIDLVFPHTGGTTTWWATVDGDTASWNVPAAEVAELLATGAQAVRLRYRDTSTGQLLWAKGSVDVQ